jgi:hypothetical protein
MTIFGHLTSRPDASLSAISGDKTGHLHDELTEIRLSGFRIGLDLLIGHAVTSRFAFAGTSITFKGSVIMFRLEFDKE